ncbi:MAG: hypothetical protein Q7T69_03415 [Rhodoferax sp.]|nr:hypothetical protein [Rhodoferax sp.]
MFSPYSPPHVLTRLRTPARMAWVLLVLCVSATAQQQGPPVEQMPAVTVSGKANPNPVEKSYRKMLKGMEHFARQHGQSPDAELRFKLLPRKPGTDMQTITLAVVGDTVDFLVPIAMDHTFTLPRNALALQEDAQVIPNRRALSMTWRTDIRTPGLPPDTRRLGDLRLECKVGMEAGLISNSSSFIGRLTSAALDTPAYCDKPAPLYLFFADRPLFSVTLVFGQRREILAIDKLYANASDDPGLQGNLPYCDCEVLVDRTYVLPLGDRSWPDDTRVEFEYMDGE